MYDDNPYSTPNPYAGYLDPAPPPPQPAQQPRKEARKDEDEDPEYTLKTIRHDGRTVRMVCQEFNGPCPLLAVCNVLLLRGEATIRGGPTVRGAQLLEVVANTVLARHPHVAARDLQAVLRLLPTLQRGLDVNVFFTRGIAGFEATDGLKLFELAGVPLVHGWLADPADAGLHAALDGLSYNSAQVVAVDPAVPAARRALVAAWLAGAPQLTPHGLRALQRDIPRLAPPAARAAAPLAVLFRNNHFAVVCHRAGALYTLVTDEGFADRTAVWELLQETRGDTRFFRDDFTPYGTRTLPLATLQTVPSAAAAGAGAGAAGSAPSVSPRTACVLDDEALARQLAAREAAACERRTAEQEDGDYALALRLQEEEEQAAAQHSHRSAGRGRAQRAQRAQKKKDGSRDDCTVQ